MHQLNKILIKILEQFERLTLSVLGLKVLTSKGICVDAIKSLKSHKVYDD